MTIDSTTTRGPYKTGIKRRAQIVAAASKIFARRGYAGSSLRMIGEAVGMTPAGLLRHFDNKQDLLMAVMYDWELQTSTLNDDTRRPGLGHFEDYVGLMRYHMTHPGLIELFLTLCTEASDPAHPAREWVANRYARIVAGGSTQLRYAIEHGEIPPMSDECIELEIRGLYAMMDGLELQWIANPALDLAEMFTNLLEMVLLRWKSATRGR